MWEEKHQKAVTWYSVGSSSGSGVKKQAVRCYHPWNLEYLCQIWSFSYLFTAVIFKKKHVYTSTPEGVVALSLDGPPQTFYRCSDYKETIR